MLDQKKAVALLTSIDTKTYAQIEDKIIPKAVTKLTDQEIQDILLTIVCGKS